MTHACALRLRACLHGVGDPGLVGLVSFVFTLWGHKTKETYPTWPGSLTPCKQGIFYLKFIWQISVQRILMNFAQTFCSTASTMKLLFSISLVSVCLFLVTARFVHFIHRQEIVEDLNARDDPGVTGLSDMPSRSSSKIHIASCRHFGMLCTHDYQCCSHHCGFPSCLW